MGDLEEIESHMRRATAAVRIARYFLLFYVCITGLIFVGALFDSMQSLIKLSGVLVVIGFVLLVWLSLLLRWFGRS